jgi:hypothetical protein
MNERESDHKARRAFEMCPYIEKSEKRKHVVFVA